jgi:hypothetical protein
LATNIKQIKGIKHKISDTEMEQIILGANGYIYGNFGINLTDYKIDQDVMESTQPFLAIGAGMGECLGSCTRPQLQLGHYGILNADNYLQIGIGSNSDNRKAGLIYNYINQLILNGEDERATLIIGNNITSDRLYTEYTTLSTLGISAPRMYIGGTFNNLKNIDETYQAVINGNTHIIGDIDAINVYATGDISSEGKVSGKTNLEYTGTGLIYLQMMKGATSSNNGTYGMVPAPSANANTLFLSNHGTWEKPSSTISLSDLIGSSIGNNNKPVYWNGSSFQAINYTIDKSVPSDAKFTDTWREVVDTLISEATDKSLSAKQGKVLNDNKLDIAGGTISLPFILKTGKVSEDYQQNFSCIMSHSNNTLTYKIDTSINNILLTSMAQAETINITVDLSNSDNISSAVGSGEEGKVRFWGTVYNLNLNGGDTSGNFNGSLTRTETTGGISSSIIIQLPSTKTFDNFTTTATIHIVATGVSRTVFQISIVDSIPRVQVIDSNGNLKTL